MHTITSFFAGIMVFFSGLFGHNIVTPPTSPLATNVQQVAVSNSTTTESSVVASSGALLSSATIDKNKRIEILPKKYYEYDYNSMYKYYKDVQYVYIGLYDNNPEIIIGADPETFSLDILSVSTSSNNYYLEFSKDKKGKFPTEMQLLSFLIIEELY